MYPRNFMGTGVVLRNVKEAVEGLPLPNIEDPQDLLTPERLFIEEPDRWHLQPLPQGFGWRQRTWYPRAALLGAYPPFLDPGHRDRGGADGAAAEESCGAGQAVAAAADGGAVRERRVARDDLLQLHGRRSGDRSAG